MRVFTINRGQMKIAWGPNVHPNIPRFWQNLRNSNHVFSRHPLFAEHGEAMARESYNNTTAGMQQHQVQMQQMMQILQQIDQIEQPIKPQLAQLAKRLVARKYGIPEQRLKAQDTAIEDVDVNDSHERFDEGLGEEQANRPVAPDDLPELNKRLTINLLKQGASTVDLMNAHNEVAQELNQLNPQLLQLYNKLGHAVHAIYYLTDTENFSNEQLGQAAGASEKLEEEEEQPGEEQEPGQQPRKNINVVAKGPCFPFLVHELTKGSFELLAHMWHTESLDEETANFIRKHADAINVEPYLIQSGPAFWKNFQTATQGIQNAPSTAHMLAYLMAAPHQQMQDICKQIAADPQQARQAVQQFVQQMTERAQQENAPVEPEMPADEEQGFEAYDPEAGFQQDQAGGEGFNDFGEFGEGNEGDDWYNGPGR